MTEEAFNWAAILKDLIAGRPLSVGEHTRLCNMALDWNDCACGQLCKDLHRPYFIGKDSAKHYYPEDSQLRSSGVEFCAAIKGEDWLSAMRIFHEIGKRADTLRNHNDDNRTE